MAQKVTVELVDDLDGTSSDDISTVTFGLDGVDYEIDLSEGNATKLRDVLTDFTAAARRTGGRIKRGAATTTSAVRPPADREQTVNGSRILTPFRHLNVDLLLVC